MTTKRTVKRMPVRLWDLIVKHSRSTKGPYHPVTDIHLGSVLTNVSVPNGGWFKYFIQYSRSLYIWYKHTGNVRLFFRVPVSKFHTKVLLNSVVKIGRTW